MDVFSTTYNSFRFLFWWTFFGGRLVSHFFGGRFLVDIWLVIFFWWTFFGGHLVGHFFGGHDLNDLFN